jgi:hypothetical protein
MPVGVSMGSISPIRGMQDSPVSVNTTLTLASVTGTGNFAIPFSSVDRSVRWSSSGTTYALDPYVVASAPTNFCEVTHR